MNKELLPSDFEVDKFKKILEYFSELAKGGVNGVIENWLLSMMERTIPFQANLWFTEKFSRIERITINKRVINKNRRIKNIKYLKYPPPNLVRKYGRCNMPGESVLYVLLIL